MKLNLVNKETSASVYLDLIRGISAIFVMLYHTGYVLFPDLSQVENPNLFFSILFSLYNRGYSFVMVFFVLSGFLVTSSTLKRIQNNTFTLKMFFVERLTRLWVVLLPSLILTYIWAQFQINISPSKEIEEKLNFQTLMGNIFFLQGVTVKAFGANTPMWSLAYEFFYYIIFAVIVFIIKTNNKFYKIISMALIIALALFVGERMMMYFLIWALGGIIVLLPLKKFTNIHIRNAATFTGVLLIILFLFLSRKMDPYNESFIIDLLIGAAFSLLLYILVSNYNIRPANQVFFITSFSTLISGFSYSLYLLHYPVLNFLDAWKKYEKLSPNTLNIFLYFLICILLILYAWLFSRVTESKTHKIKLLIQYLIVPSNKKTDITQ
ncbi:acyltransferase [Paenibacillus jamilae]|nr:acyltransferase [Paenibacillus jamilae]